MMSRASVALFALAIGVASPAFGRTPRPQPDLPQPPKISRLKSVSARQSQKAWMAVKALPPAKQAAAVREQRLQQQVCADLIDLRALMDAKKVEGFGFRDNVRQRTFARPSLALLLVSAMEKLQAELGGKRPGRLLSIGDVSQRGCGQLAHGVLVWTALGARRDVLVERARLVAGRLLAEDLVRASDFPYETDRFGPPDERVLVEHELFGEDGDGLRYSRTRYREQAIAGSEVLTMAREVEALIGHHKASEVKTRSEVVPGTGDDNGERWVVHGIDPKRERQAEVTLRRKPSGRLDWRDVTEVRLASWQDKKPGSFPGEQRWRVESAPPVPAPVKVAPGARGQRPANKQARPAPLAADALTWSRWVLVNEAGHISHLSGLDADLSYITTSNERHFAVDLEAMDVPLTWRWLEILEQTGRELGTPLDSILVDAKVKRHLMSRLPMKGENSVKQSRVWALLTPVGGHDAHHHIRIEEPSDALEKRARAKLGL